MFPVSVLIIVAVCGLLLVTIPGLLLLKCRDRFSIWQKVLLSVLLALGTLYMLFLFWYSFIV